MFATGETKSHNHINNNETSEQADAGLCQQKVNFYRYKVGVKAENNQDALRELNHLKLERNNKREALDRYSSYIKKMNLIFGSSLLTVNRATGLNILPSMTEDAVKYENLRKEYNKLDADYASLKVKMKTERKKKAELEKKLKQETVVLQREEANERLIEGLFGESGYQKLPIYDLGGKKIEDIELKKGFRMKTKWMKGHDVNGKRFFIIRAKDLITRQLEYQAFFQLDTDEATWSYRGHPIISTDGNFIMEQGKIQEKIYNSLRTLIKTGRNTEFQIA